MHASMTHIFGRDFELGSTPWIKDQQTGRVFGNPSVSEKVAKYMVSLRNRKASTSIMSHTILICYSNAVNRPELEKFQ